MYIPIYTTYCVIYLMSNAQFAYKYITHDHLCTGGCHDKFLSTQTIMCSLFIYDLYNIITIIYGVP